MLTKKRFSCKKRNHCSISCKKHHVHHYKKTCKTRKMKGGRMKCGRMKGGRMKGG